MFIVVYDDGASVFMPMGKDPSCEGAICTASTSVAIFETRAHAKHAIKISRLFAQLQESLGKPANEDFLSGYSCVRIVKAEAYA